jgi:hypothetical protein
MDLADLITLPSGKPYRRARRHQSPPPPNSHLISSLVLLFLIFYLSLTSSSFRLKKIFREQPSQLAETKCVLSLLNSSVLLLVQSVLALRCVLYVIS